MAIIVSTLKFCCGFEETLLAPGWRHLQKGSNCAIAPISIPHHSFADHQPAFGSGLKRDH
ncbi:MAG: hypothetical protein ACLPSF_13810 [Methylocella sp.]